MKYTAFCINCKSKEVFSVMEMTRKHLTPSDLRMFINELIDEAVERGAWSDHLRCEVRAGGIDDMGIMPDGKLLVSIECVTRSGQFPEIISNIYVNGFHLRNVVIAE